MRQKLTVRLPEEHLEFLKRYAADHRVTVTEVIDRYLQRLQEAETGPLHPDVERLSGLVPANVDAEAAWREHQAGKHR